MANREFEVLNANINLRVNSKTAEVKLDEVTKVLDKVSSSSKLTVDQFVKLSQEAAKTSSTVRGLNATLVSNGTQFNVVAKGAKTFAISVKQGADETASTVTKLNDRLTELDKSFLNNRRSLKQVGTDFLDSVNLISRGGSKLVATRQIFFGLGQSSNIFAKALDNLTRNANNLTNVNNRVQQSSLRVARTLVDLSTAGEASLKVLSSLGKVKGIAEKQEFGKLVSQVQNVTNEYQRLERTIQSGGKPTRETLARIATETRNLETAFKLLEAQGIIPPAELARLKETLTPLKASSQATKLLSEQMKILESEERKATEQAKKLGKTSVDGSAQGRRGWFDFFNIFKSSKQSVEATQQSIQKLNTTLQQSSAPIKTFRDTFLGVFAGNIISNAIFSLTSKIGQIPGALIKAASDAAETSNRFQAVFKELTTTADSFVDSLAKDVGRDPFAIKNSLSSLQAFNVGLGFSNESSFEMSKTLEKLILDFASFNNISDQESMERFIAAMSGSSEVLDKFGINIKEAALEQESFALGINKASADLNEQEKTMLRLSIISKSMGAQGAIGDAVRTADSFANQTKRLQANMSQLATTLGSSLLPAVAPFLITINTILERVVPSIGTAFASVATGVAETLAPIANALRDVFDAENTQVALDNLYIVIVNALDNILISIDSLTSSAFDWGASFISQIAAGIFDAVDSILQEAMNYVGDTIASFLEPGSPPEKGPLSSIDEWGKSLLDTFGSSISDSTFADTLEKKLQQASTNVLKIRQEIIDAERSGYVPPELLEKLRLAEQEKENIAQQIKDTKTLEKEQSKVAEDVNKKSTRGGSSRPESSGRERQEVEKKTAQQIRDDALAILDKQLKDGVIKYEDYAKEKLKIETKFYEDSLEAGNTVTQKTISDIKDLQKEVDTLDAASKKVDKTKKFGSIGDLDQFLAPITAQVETGGVDTGKKFVKAISQGLEDSVGDLKKTAESSFQAILPGIVTTIQSAGAFKKIIDIISGKGLISEALSDVGLLKPVQSLLKPIDKLGKFISNSFFSRVLETMINRLGFLGAILKKLGGGFLALTGPLGVVITIWSNWDLIIGAVNSALNLVNQIVDDFIHRMGGLEAVTDLFSDIEKSGKAFFLRLQKIFDSFLSDIGNIPFSDIIDKLFAGDFSGAFNLLTKSLGEAFNSAFAKLGSLLDTSSFDNSLRHIVTVGFQSIQAVVGKKLEDLKNFIVSKLPPGILEAFDNLKRRFDTTVDFVDSFIQPFRNLANFIRSNLSPSFNSISNSLSSFVTENGPKFVVALEKIRSIISRVTSIFSKQVSIIVDKVSPAFERLGLSFNLFGGEGDTFGAIIKFLGDLTASAVDIFLNVLSTAIDGVVLGLTLLDETLENNETIFDDVATILGTVIGVTVDTVAGLIKVTAQIIQLTKDGSNALSAFGQDTEANLSAFGTGINNSILDPLRQMVAGIKMQFDNLFGPSIARIQLFIDQLVSRFELIRNRLTNIVSLFSGRVDQIREVFTSRFGPIVDRVSSQFDRISVLAGKLSNLVTVLKDRLITLAVDGLVRAKNAVGELITQFTNWLTGPSVLGFLTPIIDKIKEFSSAVFDFIKPALIALGVDIDGAAKAVSVAQITFEKFVGNFLGLGLGFIFDGIIKGIDNFILRLTGVEGSLTNVGASFDSFLLKIGGILDGLLPTADSILNFTDRIITYFENLYDELIGNSIIPITIADIKNAFTVFGTDLLTIFDSPIASVLSTFASFGTNLIQSIIGGLESSKGLLTTVLGGLFGGASTEQAQPATLNTQQATQAQSLISQLSSTITLSTQLLQQTLDSFVNTSLAGITNIATQTAQAFISLNESLLGDDAVLVSLSEGILSILSTLSIRAQSEFNNLVTVSTNTLKNAGWEDISKQIINGLIRGIVTNRPRFIEKVKEVARGAIDAARIELGIKSPSIAFKDIGANVIEGFNEGLVTQPVTIDSIIGAAADDVEKFFDRFKVEGSKARLGLAALKTAFKENSKEILTSTDRAETLRKILLDSVNVEKVFGKEAGRTITAGAGEFIKAFELQAQAMVGGFVDAREAFINQLDQQRTEIIDKFNLALANVRFQTNNTRNQLEDFFREPITDNKLLELFNALERGASFGKDVDDKIRLAVASQSKLNGALKDQAAIEQSIRDLKEEEVKLGNLIPPAPEPPPISELESGLEILEGLKLGLNATVPEVLNGLNNLSTEMVRQIEEALKIKSPSEVFMRIGGQVGQGLIDGLLHTLKNIPSVVRTLSNSLTENFVADALIPNANPNQAALTEAGVLASAGVSIQVNNTINDKMDLALVERRLINTITKAIR